MVKFRGPLKIRNFHSPSNFRRCEPHRGLPKSKKIFEISSEIEEFSSENEIFERATHRSPILCGEVETSRLTFSSEIKNFDRDWKFRARFTFLIVGPSGPYRIPVSKQTPQRKFMWKTSGIVLADIGQSQLKIIKKKDEASAKIGYKWATIS